MNKEDNERRCKICGKLLLNERLPICRRCVLQGRNQTTKIGGTVGGLFLAFVSGRALADELSDGVNLEDSV